VSTDAPDVGQGGVGQGGVGQGCVGQGGVGPSGVDGVPSPYLLPGLAAPVPAADGLDEPFWSGLADECLLIQRCATCAGWQWGPDWVCHRCHGFDLGFEEIPAEGVIYRHQRVWHPVHGALIDQGPYVIVLVDFPAADGVCVVGNLLGDPLQLLEIGSRVTGVFEHHRDNDPPFTLLHWCRPP
jgi:uncharacterized OB-fold protein